MRPAPTSNRSDARAVAYVRVSTAEQVASGLGLEAQKAAIVDCARRQGFTLTQTYTDEGQSGAAPLDQRTGLLTAIEALRPNDVLMIAKLDRLSRGDVIESAVIEELVSRKHARILSAGGEGTDRDDPTAHLTRRMLQLVAGYERSLIAARTKAALAAKKARGEKIGAEPYGQSDTEKAIVATIADCRTAGFSFEATAAELTRRGFTTRRGTPWRAQYVRSLVLTLTGIRSAQTTTSRQTKATRAALAIVGRRE